MMIVMIMLMSRPHGAVEVCTLHSSKLFVPTPLTATDTTVEENLNLLE